MIEEGLLFHSCYVGGTSRPLGEHARARQAANIGDRSFRETIPLRPFRDQYRYWSANTSICQFSPTNSLRRHHSLLESLHIDTTRITITLHMLYEKKNGSRKTALQLYVQLLCNQPSGAGTRPYSSRGAWGYLIKHTANEKTKT